MPSINTYFSQKDNLQKVILAHLDSAQISVIVAVAWFTDKKLFKKLLTLQKEGIKIELIITNHQFNDESGNNYHAIKQNGGVFLEIGGDYQTMHHKFCIVDNKKLLQGSFNWTKKANESNNETLLVIEEDYQSIGEFISEFDRLKKLAGHEKEIKQLEISKALKYFTLIKTFIDLGKSSEIYPYLQELKDIDELSNIVDMLSAGEFERAITAMDDLQRNYTSIINVSHFEKEALIFKIKLLSEQIRQLEIEQTTIEEVITAFNRRSYLELNPIISKIIELKKKIYEKLKIKDSSFEDLNKEYQKVNSQLATEKEKEVPDLSEDEKQVIQKMYYEASKLCHPDSPNCVIEDKSKAQEIFSALSIAYKDRDLKKVKNILDELKNGSLNPDELNESQMDKLRQKLAFLEFKYKKHSVLPDDVPVVTKVDWGL